MNASALHRKPNITKGNFWIAFTSAITDVQVLNTIKTSDTPNSHSNRAIALKHCSTD